MSDPLSTLPGDPGVSDIREYRWATVRGHLGMPHPGDLEVDGWELEREHPRYRGTYLMSKKRSPPPTNSAFDPAGYLCSRHRKAG